MERLKRFTLTLLASSLVFGLTACGNLEQVKDQIGDQVAEKGAGVIRQIANGLSKYKEVELPEYEMGDLGVSAEGYYYQHISEEEQKAYKAILAGLLKREESIVLPVSYVNTDNVVKFRDYILMDHPEIFWFGGSCQTLETTKEFEIQPEYTFDQGEIESYQQAIQEEKQRAMEVIDGKLGDEAYARESDSEDYRIAKAVFEYVIDEVEYDKNSPDNQVLISSMVNKESVCEGIARMTQYLLQQYEIEATLVEGYHTGSNEPHAWLIVKIDDEYYHMDPTFGNAAFSQRENEEMSDIPELRYHYAELLMSDEVAERSHKITPYGDVTLPSCDSNAKNYFVLTGAYIPEEAESPEWTAHFLDTMASGYSYWEVQFEDYWDFEECLEEVQDDGFDDELFNLIDMSQYSKEYYNYDDETYVIVWWLE